MFLFQGGRPGLDDVSSLDATLHTNLLAVKACPPEQVEHLGLTFAAEQQLLGKVSNMHHAVQLGGQHSHNQLWQAHAIPAAALVHGVKPARPGTAWGLKAGLTSACKRYVVLQTVQYDLLPNGDSIAVTASNRLLYVYLLADWHLNARLGRAASAFASESLCTFFQSALLSLALNALCQPNTVRLQMLGSLAGAAGSQTCVCLLAQHCATCRPGDVKALGAAGGLSTVLPPSWLRLFSPSELNQLISGGLDTGVDVDDMAK